MKYLNHSLIVMDKATYSLAAEWLGVYDFMALSWLLKFHVFWSVM